MWRSSADEPSHAGFYCHVVVIFINAWLSRLHFRGSSSICAMDDAQFNKVIRLGGCDTPLATKVIRFVAIHPSVCCAPEVNLVESGRPIPMTTRPVWLILYVPNSRSIHSMPAANFPHNARIIAPRWTNLITFVALIHRPHPTLLLYCRVVSVVGDNRATEHRNDH